MRNAISSPRRGCGAGGLLLAFFFALSSLQGHAFVQERVLLGFNKSPLPEVLKKIEKAYHVSFTYDPKRIVAEKNINLQEKLRSLSQLLLELSDVTGFKFLQSGNLVGIYVNDKEGGPVSGNDFQSPPEKLFKGLVTDDKLQPLPGISVQVKGTTRGAVTTGNGTFSLKAAIGEVLLVSAIGFIQQEIILGDKDTLTITLLRSDKELSEVVVTALGIKKEKVKLGYAVQEVKGEELQKAREPNVASSLTGKVAGLTVYNRSTLFANQQVELRGGATVIVVDGVPSRTDFWNINPDDIESINVLKGTAASALYGSIGINGAIEITTKQGKSGANGVEVSFNSSNQMQAGFLRVPDVQDQYGMGFNGKYAFVDGAGGGIYDNYGYVWGPKLNQPDPGTKSGFVEIPQYNSPRDPATGKLVPLPWVTRSTNNLKKFLSNEFLTSDNISIAGKTDKADFRVSLTQLYQKGQVPGTKLNATTLSLAGSLRVNEKIKIGANLSYNKQYSPNYPTTGYGPDNYFYNIALWMGPDVDINDLKQYWQPGKEGSQQRTYNYSWYNNPWFLANEYRNAYRNDIAVGQMNMRYDIRKDLLLTVRSGATISNVFTETLTPFSYINYGTSKAPFGNYSQSKNMQMRIMSDFLLTYKKDFLRNINLSISAGGSNRYDQDNSLTAKTADLSVPGTYNLANSRGPVTASNSGSEKSVSSLYGMVDIAYGRIVYLSLTGRNDWTSSLKKPYNSFFYPSASLSVVPSEMMKMPDFISLIKLRASWANLSSDPAAYYTVSNYKYGTRWGGTPSLSLPGIIIPDNLRPQRTISQEYGVEARFLHNRIGADLTYYTYQDKDQLVDFPVSESSGYSSRRSNGFRYNRRGVEVVLMGTPVRNYNFQWNVNANYSIFRRYVREFYGDITESNGLKIGDRTDVYRGYAWDRSPDGQIIYDKDGKPTYYNKQVVMGYTGPNAVLGISNNFRYRQFGLSFSFDGRIGGKMFNGLEGKLYEGGMHPATVNSYRDDSNNGIASYVGKGVVVTSGTVERDAAGNITKDTRVFAPNTTKVLYQDWVLDYYSSGIDESVLYDQTFVKLREVVLSYSLPTNLLKRTFFSAASFSLVGRNLFLWTNVPFTDPDGGYSGYNLPEPTYRNIGFNVNLKF